MNAATLLVVSVVFLVCPVLAAASHADIHHLALRLEQASSDLARDARRLGGSGSLGHHAQRLAGKAAELSDSVARNRTAGFVRTRFNDVSRQFRRLETSYFRESRPPARELQREFNGLAETFEALRMLVEGHPYEQGYRQGPSPYLPYLPDRGYRVPYPPGAPSGGRPPGGRLDEHPLYQPPWRHPGSGLPRYRYDHTSPVETRQWRRAEREQRHAPPRPPARHSGPGDRQPRASDRGR